MADTTKKNPWFDREFWDRFQDVVIHLGNEAVGEFVERVDDFDYCHHDWDNITDAFIEAVSIRALLKNVLCYEGVTLNDVASYVYNDDLSDHTTNLITDAFMSELTDAFKCYYYRHEEDYFVHW